MANLYSREVEPNHYHLSPPLTLDVYILNLLKDNKISYLYDFPTSKEKATLRQIITTVVLNFAAGIWSIAKTPKRSHYINNMLSRSPQDVYNDNYLTIIPSVLPKLAKELKLIEDAVQAGDKPSAMEAIARSKKLMAASVASYPQDVTKIVDKMKDYSKMFRFSLYPKSRNRKKFRWVKTDYEHTKIFLKRSIPLSKYREVFGDTYLRFSATGERVIFGLLEKENFIK